MTLLNFLAAPTRLPRRFEEWCETPGHFERVIKLGDRYTPVVVVTVFSLLVGVILTGIILTFLQR